jgi:hypothetical protein
MRKQVSHSNASFSFMFVQRRNLVCESSAASSGGTAFFLGLVRGVDWRIKSPTARHDPAFQAKTSAGSLLTNPSSFQLHFYMEEAQSLLVFAYSQTTGALSS